MSSELASVHVAVLGLGYVGCVSAACLAQLGYRVTVIDRAENKVNNVVNGIAPFFEPGLERLVRENAVSGRLTASTAISAIHDADIALVCVGTPSEKNGNLGLDQLRRGVGGGVAAVFSPPLPLLWRVWSLSS